MRTSLLVACVVALLWPPTTAGADPPVDDTLAGYALALAERPHDVALLRERAELLVLSGDAAAALEDVRVALALAPDDVTSLVIEGRALTALGRSDEALGALDRALSVAPECFDARRARADLRIALGDRRGAIEDLDEALRAGSDLDAFLDRSRWLVEEGRAAEAAQGLDDALVRTHEAGPIVLAAIDAHLVAHEPAAALAIVDAAVARTPSDPRLVLLRGDVLARADRGAEAREAFERALATIDARLARRRTVASLVDRGDALARLGRTDEARAALEAAAALAPRYPRVLALASRLRRTP